MNRWANAAFPWGICYIGNVPNALGFADFTRRNLVQPFARRPRLAYPKPVAGLAIWAPHSFPGDRIGPLRPASKNAVARGKLRLNNPPRLRLAAIDNCANHRRAEKYRPLFHQITPKLLRMPAMIKPP